MISSRFFGRVAFKRAVRLRSGDRMYANVYRNPARRQMRGKKTEMLVC